MTAAEVVEFVPMVVPLGSHGEAAAELLEKAVKAGCKEPQVYYLLALAHKRQGKTAEARAALRQIPRPDAGIILLMGLLSLQERQLAQAELEFARAFEADPASYPACYNLLMTRLTLGQTDTALALVPQALPLAPSAEERHFLSLLQGLLRTVPKKSPGTSDEELGPLVSASELDALSSADEQRLLALARGLGDVETSYRLLRSLASLPRQRGETVVQEAYLEAALARAKTLLDRSAWGEAERLLGRLARDKTALMTAARPVAAAFYNLVGCCACLNQDFQAGVRHFMAAAKMAGNDPRIHQNLALAYELQGELSQAEPHWNRYFDLIENADPSRRLPTPPGQIDYLERLIYEALSRLAGRFSEKERWHSALTYVQRAHRLRPRDPDTLERLFQLQVHAKRNGDARRALQQLRELRPGEPQYDLYELDLIEVKGLNEIERLLTEIDQIRKRYPGNAQVEERAIQMVGNVIPMISNLCDQLTEQMSHVIDQVRDVPSYQQVNWPAVREVMGDLRREFLKLRRITSKCLPLVTHDEHRRIIRELTEHIDRKIDVCREMGA